MEFRILGPLEVVERGRLIALRGGKPRALLAILLLHANEVVTTERLVEELWPDSRPATAAKNLQLYVSQLRKALATVDGMRPGQAPLTTRAGGYALRVDDGHLDSLRFERLIDDGREALRASRPEEASKILREALSLWRGPALVDFSYEPFAQREIARLEELRIAAVEEQVEADLALGRHAELVPELEVLAAEHPLRERLWGQLMLALYRSDRQADALEVYRQARSQLVEQLGLEPGPTLQRLEHDILIHSSDLAPPWARGKRRAGLPSLPNETIGRERELRKIVERLRERRIRLITLIGPGGAGKTRLALEAGRAVEADFADGAQLVLLAGVRQADDVPAAIVAALGIVPMTAESTQEAVERFLASRHFLLVLDNCEHLLGAARFIGELLARCPQVRVLTTSRQPLALQAEYCHPVPPLELPDRDSPGDPELLARVAAVRLFLERAQAHDPDFSLTAANAAAVIDICRRVDGLPLAIELAAARCGLMSPPELARRLRAALDAPGAGARDAPARQQTLRATIDWSYALLNEVEKTSFECFSVFVGGATLEAAEAVTGGGFGALDGLVAKSLLVRRHEPSAPTRLAMLETVRAHAAGRLAGAPERDEVAERHCHFYLAVAERHGTEKALWRPQREEHLAALDADVDNLDAALRWATRRARSALALALVTALGPYWLIRNRYAYAAAWIDNALSLPGDGSDAALRAAALLVKDWLMWPLGRGGDRAVIVDEAVALARDVGDPGLISRTLRARAHVALRTERIDAANALAEQAMAWANTAGDEWEIANAACELANAARSRAELLDRVAKAETMLCGVGNVHKRCSLLASAGYGAIYEGADRDAMAFLERAEALARDLEEPHAAMMISGNLGLAALFLGRLDTAHAAFRKELLLCRELATLPVAHEALRGLAGIAVADGDDRRAACLLGAATAHRYGDPEDAVDARLRATFYEPARARTDAGAWARSFRHGTTLGFEEAIAYALSSTTGQTQHHDEARAAR